MSSTTNKSDADGDLSSRSGGISAPTANESADKRTTAACMLCHAKIPPIDLSNPNPSAEEECRSKIEDKKPFLGKEVLNLIFICAKLLYDRNLVADFLARSRDFIVRLIPAENGRVRQPARPYFTGRRSYGGPTLQGLSLNSRK